MDVYLADLFNNGENAGDIVIVSNDNVRMKCHTFVLEATTEYIKTLKSFRKQTNDVSNEIKLDYDAIIIRFVLNKLYNSDYENKNWPPSAEDILEDIKLIEELQVIPGIKTKVVNELVENFHKGIRKNNWIKLLEKTYQIDIYKELTEKIVSSAKYFLCEMNERDLPEHLKQPLARYFTCYTSEISPKWKHADKNNIYVWLTNETKDEYIFNPVENKPEAIDSFLYFLFKNKIWKCQGRYKEDGGYWRGADEINIHKKKYPCDISEKYHKINFVIDFYRKSFHKKLNK